MEQYRLSFRAPNGYPSSCDVTVYAAIPLVVASETGEGMSVTNAADVIATAVVHRHDLDPRRLIYVEHYSEEQRPLPFGECYSLVTFTWNGKQAKSPAWQHLPNADFAGIVATIQRDD